MDKSKQTIDFFIYFFIYLLIFMVSLFFPFIIIISIFLLPIPVIVYTEKYNLRHGLLLTIILLLVSFVIGSYVALAISLFATIGGLLIGHKMHQKASAYETLIQGAIGYTFGLAFAYLISHVFLQVNWLDVFNDSMQQSIDTFAVVMKQFLMESEIEQQIKLIEEQLTRLSYTFTAILFMVGVLFAFITQWLSYKWLNWREQKQYYFPPFRNLSFPAIVIWIHLFVIIMQYVPMEDGSFLYMIVVNVLPITSLLIIIQGFSFIFFFAYYKKIHVIVPIIVTILALMLAPVFLIFIRFIGIIDIGFRWKQHLLQNEQKK